MESVSRQQESPFAGMLVATAASIDDEAHNKVWYLQQSPLFADVGSDTVEGVQGIFRMVRYSRKTLLFDLGDNERTIYIIKQGTVRLARLSPEGKEITIAVLGPGDMFGEEVLFSKARRTTIAIVVEDALLCCSRAEDLFESLAQDATLAMNVAGMISSRLGHAGESMEDLAYARLPDRIMNLFERLCEKHGDVGSAGTALTLRLTHAEIASLVGSTRESVSVEMQKLAAAGRIQLQGKKIFLPAARP